MSKITAKLLTQRWEMPRISGLAPLIGLVIVSLTPLAASDESSSSYRIVGEYISNKTGHEKGEDSSPLANSRPLDLSDAEIRITYETAASVDADDTLPEIRIEGRSCRCRDPSHGWQSRTDPIARRVLHERAPPHPQVAGTEVVQQTEDEGVEIVVNHGSGEVENTASMSSY